MATDYLIVGSGLAGLTVGALMAKAGRRVTVLEAHEFPGGYGHTFQMGPYTFNAQLHYVWNCGEGRTVHNLLKKLDLHQTVTFEQYDADGFDHMRMPGYALDVPYDYAVLIERLTTLFPEHADGLRGFVHEVKRLSETIDDLPRLRPRSWKTYARTLAKLVRLPRYARLLPYQRMTLQQVFDRFRLPLEAQTLLALQWPDFMLPPGQLSFMAWLLLFSGYCRGAYYPTHHFDHVIDSLVGVLEAHGGRILYQHTVTQFLTESNRIVGAIAETRDAHEPFVTFRADAVICNMDPRRAAEMIGLARFSRKVRRKLNYDYSPSNFMAYCAVSGIDLRDYGFGKWNLFHTELPDLNEAFHRMYDLGDYRHPSFAVTVPGLLTDDASDAPEGHQIVEFLTVANYQRFLALRISNPAAYRKKKKEIFDSILDVMERRYVPDFRKYLVFKSTGSPTSNERYCWSPVGNSYGSNMTPANMGFGRLDHRSSINGLYFCNASSGYAGFSGTVWTGCRLYESLTGDSVLG